MPDFARREGESARAWTGRLRFADILAHTAREQDELYAQRGRAAAAAETEEEQQTALAVAAAESDALRGCKAAALDLAPADRQALLRWLQEDARR